jgi:outer membrane protein assembly factor BamB
MGFPRAILESGPESARFHVHLEEGRGRGALSTLLMVPREPDALANVLRDLHDPAGPADLDSRLGRMAGSAPAGTAFLVALDDLVWIFPSPDVRCRRLRDGAALDLDEPQVLRMKPGDEFEATTGAGDRLGRLHVEAPHAPGVVRAADSDGPLAAPHRRRRSTKRVAALTASLAFAAVLGWTLLTGAPSSKAPRADAHVGPSLESRLVSFLTGAGSRAAGGAPDSVAARPDGEEAGHTALPAKEIADAVVGDAPLTEPRTTPPAEDPPVRADAPPDPAGRIAPWEFQAGGAITSSPLLRDGRLVFGSRDGKLYCLDAANGAVVWTLKSGSGIGSSPCAEESLCYVGNYAGELLAVNVGSGKLAWKARTAGRIVSSPCVVDGIVLVGSYDRSIYAFDAKTGKKRWSAPTGGAVRASPEPVGDGSIVIGSTEGTIYCLAVRDGKTRWKRKAAAAVHAPAAWDAKTGCVVVASRDGSVLALDAETGKVAWSAKVGAAVNARPAFHDDVVLVGTGRGRLLALAQSDGARKWEAEARRGFDATPLVIANHVVAPSSDGTVHVLDATTGAVQDRRRLASEIFTSPAGGDGLVYVGTLHGSLHALGLP